MVVCRGELGLSPLSEDLFMMQIALLSFPNYSSNIILFRPIS